MLNSDFEYVEMAIIKRKYRILKQYKKKYGDFWNWTNEVAEQYAESIKPLNAALKSLKDGYFKS